VSNASEDFNQGSDWFWKIISSSEGRPERLREIIQEMAKEDIRRFQEEFVDLRAELMDEPFDLHAEDSIDALEDVAGWVISKGREMYRAVLADPTLMPVDVEGKEAEILVGVAHQVYEERFSEPLDVF